MTQRDMLLMALGSLIIAEEKLASSAAHSSDYSHAGQVAIATARRITGELVDLISAVSQETEP